MFLLLHFFSLCLAADWNKLGERPLLGWNSWCTSATCHQHGKPTPAPLHDVCHEREIKEVAQAMIKNGLQAAGYRMIALDDCWCYPVRNGTTGEVYGDPTRFPSGMAAMAAWLHERGFQFGLYLSLGYATCSQGGRATPVTGSYGHYELDARTMARWRIDQVKFDWCKHEGLDQTRTTLAAARGLAATTRPIWLNFHCGEGKDGPVGHRWCIDAGNSFRVSHDVGDLWNSTRDIVNDVFLQRPTTRAVSAQAAPGHWNDLDGIMIGGAGCSTFEPGRRCPGQSEREYLTQLSVWSVFSSQLLVMTDVRRATSFMLRALTNSHMLRVNQHWHGWSGGLVATLPCDVMALAKPLADDEQAVTLTNMRDAPCDQVRFNFTRALGAPWQRARVYSIWHERWFDGAHAHVLTVERIEPHETYFLLFSKE